MIPITTVQDELNSIETQLSKLRKESDMEVKEAKLHLMEMKSALSSLHQEIRQWVKLSARIGMLERITRWSRKGA